MAEPEGNQNNIPVPPAAVTQAGGSTQEQQLSTLLQSIKAPIPGENPCGRDITYDDDYQKIKAAIDNLGGISTAIDQARVADGARQLRALGSIASDRERREQLAKVSEGAASFVSSGGADFGAIADISSTILAQKSKDLRVAGFLALALAHRHGAAGVAEGVSAFKILVHHFWDGLYPAKQRMAGRKAAVEFFTQYMSEAVKSAEISLDDAASLERAKAALDELQKDLNEKMGDAAATVVPLSKAIEDSARKVPKPTTAVRESAVGTAPGTPTAVGSVEVEVKSLQGAVDMVRRAAAFLRGHDRKSAAPYRLLRSIRWDPLTNEPPNENGKTKIEAPLPQRQTYFDGLQQSGQWEKLLEEGEASFAQPPFHLWFDLQRLVVASLDALGPDYGIARTSILQELAILIRRVPGLPMLTFSDGTNFAVPATQAWIRETVLAAPGAGWAPTSAQYGGDAATELATEYEKAKRSVDKGDVAGAVALMQNGAFSDSSRRIRFAKRLYSAMLCIRGNKVQAARPVLEALSEEVERFCIDEWEPQMALDVWTNLKKCYEALAVASTAQAKQAYQQKIEEVFEKICRLDMTYALATTGIVQRSAGRVTPAGVQEAGAEGEHEQRTSVAPTLEKKEAKPETTSSKTVGRG